MDLMADRLDIREIALARRSAQKEPWQVADVRLLTREDLALIHSAPTTPSDPKAPLARIAEPHHMLAKLVAEGKAVVEISAVTGYSTSRIHTLKADPAFCELVAHYETEHVMAEANISAQIQHVALAAKQILLERLEDSPESFTHKELKEIMAMGLDRIGHGPSSKVNLSVNNTAEIIAQMRESLQSGGRVISRQEIEAEYHEVSDETPPSEGTPQS